MGGAATETLSITGDGPVTDNATAQGGTGAGSSSGTGGAGGKATITETATTASGSGEAHASGTAVGGNGGTGATRGLGGTATSTVTANASAGTGQAYGDALATGGTTGGGSTLAAATPTATAQTRGGANATAYTSANGGSGIAKATAITAGTVGTGRSTLTINSLTAISSAPVSGSTTTHSNAVNGAASNTDFSYNSEAYAGGGAKFGGLGPHVGAKFNAATMFVFGSGAMSAVASSSTSTTYTSSMEWNVNTSTLPSGSGHDLDLGRVNASTDGSGFRSLIFSLSEDGVSKLSKLFTTVSAANAYFTDDLVNLGQWTFGSTLDVLVSLSETTMSGSGNGYGVNYLVGVDPPVGSSRTFGPRAPVPEPASASVFGLGLLGIGWSKLRRKLCRPS